MFCEAFSPDTKYRNVHISNNEYTQSFFFLIQQTVAKGKGSIHEANSYFGR